MDHPVMKKTDGIWHYTAEGCRRGNDCGFSHSISLNDEEVKVVRGIAKNRSRTLSQTRQDRSSNTKCQLFAAGHCRYGDKCIFKHE